MCRTCFVLQEELEVLAQKKAAAVRAEKTAGQLRKEVRLLQEALADNNIIIDKVRGYLVLFDAFWNASKRPAATATATPAVLSRGKCTQCGIC